MSTPPTSHVSAPGAPLSGQFEEGNDSRVSTRPLEADIKIQGIWTRFQDLSPGQQSGSLEDASRGRGPQEFLLNELAKKISSAVVENFSACVEPLSDTEQILLSSCKMYERISKPLDVSEVIPDEVQDLVSDQHMAAVFRAYQASSDDFLNLRGSEARERLKKLCELYKECVAINLRSSIEGTSRSRSRESTGSERSLPMDLLRNTAEVYRQKYEGSFLPENKQEHNGTIKQAGDCLFDMISKYPIVILGEGSHEERVMDDLLSTFEFVVRLKAAGVTHVLFEHLYENHVKEGRLDPDVVDHLRKCFLGGMHKAIRLAYFLTLCLDHQIKVVPVDSPSIHRPRDDDLNQVDMNTYNSGDRLECLNDVVVWHIEKLRGEGNRSKILIIVGAAHTNHHNAKSSRKDSPIVADVETAGLAEVLQGAEEMIISSAADVADKSGLYSVKNGSVFFIEQRQTPEKDSSTCCTVM